MEIRRRITSQLENPMTVVLLEKTDTVFILWRIARPSRQESRYARIKLLARRQTFKPLMCWFGTLPIFFLFIERLLRPSYLT